MSTIPQFRSLDAHEKPPEPLRLTFKRLQRSTISDLQSDTEILRPKAHQIEDDSKVRVRGFIAPETLSPIFNKFIDASSIANSFPTSQRLVPRECRILEATEVPGVVYRSFAVESIGLIVTCRSTHISVSSDP